MKVLWESSPRSLGELTEGVARASPWHPNTIKTFVRRLVRKGVIATLGRPGGYQYVPRVTRAAAIRAENRSFLDRLYGGRLKPMLVALLQDENLTPEDIAELRQILDERK